MPCSPNNINVIPPSSTGSNNIPGFGNPFALKVPNLVPNIDGFPEDLLDLFNTLSLALPPMTFKANLSKNYGKDIFDGIMTLMDKFLPFLALYKFFLPMLNLIICIIEVLCAIPNPFKLPGALARLFTKCLPDFLNLFPIFAFIIMIISLLLLLLALIEYIIAQIISFVEGLLKNINYLIDAFHEADGQAVFACLKKLGITLCIFQNLFVILALFNIIVGSIKDILALGFSIPPCADSGSTTIDGAGLNIGCCTPDVCPAIVKNPYTRTTGVFQYLNQIGIQTSVVLPPPFNNFNVAVRSESWQLYDPNQTQIQEFINIVDAFDVTGIIPKPVFFPTDVIYNANTVPRQAVYAIDLRLFYDPLVWGRTGVARYIQFKDCIVSLAPTRNLINADNTITTHTNGVVLLTGGSGYEDDGTTILYGFADDGIAPITTQANLNNFIHRPAVNSLSPVYGNGDVFSDVQYTFKPNISALLNKNLVTLGCEPNLNLNKNFINTVFAGDIGIKTQLFSELINSQNGNTFPDTAAAQACLTTALDALRVNMTADGVAQFQTTANICLQKLKDDTTSALTSAIGLGFEPCKSTITLSPKIQFTSKPIIISVNLNERNGLPITNGIPATTANNLAEKIKAHATLGVVDNFVYDGYQSFTANITSIDPGSGQIMISFDNNIFCTNNIPASTSETPTHDLQTLDYQFIYTPVGGTITTSGDEGTQPRRNEGDLSNEGNNGGN